MSKSIINSELEILQAYKKRHGTFLAGKQPPILSSSSHSPCCVTRAFSRSISPYDKHCTITVFGNQSESSDCTKGSKARERCDPHPHLARSSTFRKFYSKNSHTCELCYLPTYFAQSSIILAVLKEALTQHCVWIKMTR